MPSDVQAERQRAQASRYYSGMVDDSYSDEDKYYIDGTDMLSEIRFLMEEVFAFLPDEDAKVTVTYIIETQPELVRDEYTPTQVGVQAASSNHERRSDIVRKAKSLTGVIVEDRGIYYVVDADGEDVNLTKALVSELNKQLYPWYANRELVEVFITLRLSEEAAVI